ncbi:hypothetical protein [Pseudonocardia sp. DLS-67]
MDVGREVAAEAGGRRDQQPVHHPGRGRGRRFGVALRGRAGQPQDLVDVEPAEAEVHPAGVQRRDRAELLGRLQR